MLTAYYLDGLDKLAFKIQIGQGVLEIKIGLQAHVINNAINLFRVRLLKNAFDYSGRVVCQIEVIPDEETAQIVFVRLDVIQARNLVILLYTCHFRS